MDDETDRVDASGSGRFNPRDRQIATTAALPLLAAYFADASSYVLETRPRVGTGDGALDELTRFVRMRVTLAASARLETLLARIVEHPSFQYSRTADVSPGMLRGQLDVTRYVQSRLRHESPRRYPVRVLERRYATRDNALAAYAARWTLRELADAPLTALPPRAPERTEIVERRSRLLRLLMDPVLADAQALAIRVQRGGGLRELVDGVEQRIATGRIAAADRYRDLVDWVRTFRPRDVAAIPGTVDWRFYGERFDPKLFEIWTLSRLLDVLERRFGPPLAGRHPLTERTRRAVATWHLGGEKVSVLFQPSLARLGGTTPRWRAVAAAERYLEGFPDIGVVIEAAASTRSVVLVDPKLRIRRGTPVEELYKMLGYFGNLSVPARVDGAIVFYGPGASRTYTFQNGDGDRLLALGVDLVDDAASSAQFEQIADLVARRSGAGAEMLEQLRHAAVLEDEADAVEARAMARQRAAVEDLLATAAGLSANDLEPTRRAMAWTLHRVWDSLPPAIVTMVVSAEYFAQRAPTDADHSGPLLGLTAACERMLFETVFRMVAERQGCEGLAGATLGALIETLARALKPEDASPIVRATREAINRWDAASKAMLPDLVVDLRHLNKRYRIPAAHREIVSQELWIEGRDTVLNPDAGLLRRLAGLGEPGVDRFRMVSREEAEPYRRHLPAYTLTAAAGVFLRNEPVAEMGWVEVLGMRLHDDMFVARVEGRSMEPRIPDGSWCVFRGDRGGSLAGTRVGRIVLVHARDIDDPDGAGEYTVKRYQSGKAPDGEGGWHHDMILLESLNPAYAPIVLRQQDDVSVVAEFVAVLGGAAE